MATTLTTTLGNLTPVRSTTSAMFCSREGVLIFLSLTRLRVVLHAQTTRNERSGPDSLASWRLHYFLP